MQISNNFGFFFFAHLFALLISQWGTMLYPGLSQLNIDNIILLGLCRPSTYDQNKMKHTQLFKLHISDSRHTDNEKKFNLFVFNFFIFLIA